MVWNEICALGRREGVAEAADPQAVGSCVELWRDCRKRVGDVELVPLNHDSMTERLEGTIYSVEKKEAAASRALDQVVDVAGSRVLFGGVLTAITGWAIAGAVTGAPDLWQIILQDVSSIQCYISDMILMRQQMNDFREHLRIIALLRSRSYTITKCFRLLIEQERLEAAASPLHRERSVDIAKLSSAELTPLSSEGYPHITVQTLTNFESSDSLQHRGRTKTTVFHDLEGAARELDAIGNAISLAPEDFIDRVIVIIADVMGSIWMLIAFVIGIVAWIALGPKYGFSNNWQLWLNTCTALQQTLSTSLLTLARKRHTNFIERCMCAIFRQDCEVEYRARTLIGYDGPNEVVKIEWAAEHRFERSLDW
jgi:low-affinity ferrous iron transport protein